MSGLAPTKPNQGAQAFGARTSSRAAAGGADNRAVAAKLEEYASLLEQQQANSFRVKAYEHAAQVIAGLERPVGEILATEGQAGLTALPGIGVAIAGAVTQLADTGRWPQLERLRGTLEPEALFRSLPGVGPQLARGLAEDMHLDTLEALESAASDGSLDQAKGWGRKRVAMVRAATAERLGRARLRARGEPSSRPGVDLILDVDREYRRKAAAGELRRIAPKRFNPTHEAWLPILHAERGPWSFTALFSNTAKAHELDRTRDWVVIYHHTDAAPEGQCTVVTETHGPMAGLRVVRGREAEGGLPPGSGDRADAGASVKG
jgi:hypothetical protein